MADEQQSVTFPDSEAEATSILVVSDLDRSVRWWRDVVGAELQREYGGSSAVFRFVGSWLLVVTGGPPTDDKPGITFAVPQDPERVANAITVRVRDCVDVYETLRARGAEFLAPPVASEHEVRCFTRDPDGHLLEFSQLR